MRDIKFRAWHKKQQQMYIICELSFMNDSSGNPLDRGCGGYYGDNHRDRFALDEITLMQYIGLEDKNIKEVYTGDLIKARFGEWITYEPEIYGGDICDKKNVELEELDIIGEVKIRIIGGTGFIIRGGRLNGRFIKFNKSKPFEVIGNIYENPLPIKDKK